MNNKNIKAPYMAMICFIVEDLPKDRNACRALLNSLEQVCNSAEFRGGGNKKCFIRFAAVVHKEWKEISAAGIAFVAINKFFERLKKEYPDFDFFEHTSSKVEVEISNLTNSEIEIWAVDMADFLSGNEEPCENFIDIL